MPNTSYTDALKEVATLAPNGVAMLETLSISHPSAGSIYIVNDRQSLSARDENNVPQTYQASSFAVKLPSSTAEGVQSLNITIPNVDRAASDFLKSVPVDSSSPVTATFRIYQSGQPDTAQPDNEPLTLDITDVQVDMFQVSARARFKSPIIIKHPNVLYTLKQFPALGN